MRSSDGRRRRAVRPRSQAGTPGRCCRSIRVRLRSLRQPRPERILPSGGDCAPPPIRIRPTLARISLSRSVPIQTISSLRFLLLLSRSEAQKNPPFSAFQLAASAMIRSGSGLACDRGDPPKRWESMMTALPGLRRSRASRAAAQRVLRTTLTDIAASLVKSAD
jgi:hypothetical protein